MSEDPWGYIRWIFSELYFAMWKRVILENRARWVRSYLFGRKQNGTIEKRDIFWYSSLFNVSTGQIDDMSQWKKLCGRKRVSFRFHDQSKRICDEFEIISKILIVNWWARITKLTTHVCLLLAFAYIVLRVATHSFTITIACHKIQKLREGIHLFLYRMQ